MTIFILTMIILVPFTLSFVAFTLSFVAYTLTDGFVLNENYSIDENKYSNIVTLKNSVQLCFENIA